MKKVFKGFMVAAAVTLSAGVALNAAADTAKLDQLLEQVKKDRISEAKLDSAREKEFLSDRADKQGLLNKAKATFNAEDARGKALTKKYAENEGALASKAAELQTALGTLGEVVGMVRQNAAETIGSISSSVISAQYPGRAELLSKLASAKEVPNIKELEDLWIALQTEMTESAKTAKFETQVVNLDGSTETKQVTRIGTLNLMSDSQYLLYNADTKQVQPLGRDPESYIVDTVVNYAKAAPGELVGIYIDPTAGSLLRLNTQKATLEDKFHQGGPVGYAISILAVIGVLLGLFRMLILAGV
ncbi:MAG: MotA/TolQ/ExbB proton channel family protein, partial [Gammaproteobacteria bacterium]|nr:MotA/TolQ/ExbB proton channel family protein [Gammaproteobacteria bacterium]